MNYNKPKVKTLDNNFQKIKKGLRQNLNEAQLISKHKAQFITTSNIHAQGIVSVSSILMYTNQPQKQYPSNLITKQSTRNNLYFLIKKEKRKKKQSTRQDSVQLRPPDKMTQIK